MINEAGDLRISVGTNRMTTREVQKRMQNLRIRKALLGTPIKVIPKTVEGEQHLRMMK
jgi:hypothetical protein